jgi:hypothetical protein
MTVKTLAARLTSLINEKKVKKNAGNEGHRAGAGRCYALSGILCIARRQR